MSNQFTVNTMVVNKQPYVLSEWNESLGYYINTWFGYISRDEFIEAVLIGQQFMINNKVKYHLADTTKMSGGWDGEEWLYGNFWPSVIDSGLTHFGLIIPDSNLIGQASDLVMRDEMASRGLKLSEYRTFETLLEAEAWLRGLS